MTRIALFLQWAAMVIALALTAQAAPAATPDNPPPHWVPGRGDQGWQWKYRVWLPDKALRVAVCETHLDWNHANGSFVSAFGITRREYNADAAYMNSVPWNDVTPPSPWHQWRAAQGHRARFHGWSGWGCRGA